jgi:hypothetical protein
VIPDDVDEIDNNMDLPIPNRALVFLQKATLACLTRVAKKQFFIHYCKSNVSMGEKLSKAYVTMIRSFNIC